MIQPNYENGSIVNLVSSITTALGNSPATHNPLPLLDTHFISAKKNVVFIVLDGLGYNFIMEQDSSFIKSNLVGNCTSVFPSTTATAITSFLTGMSPAQHAVTGWFVYLKELGTISAILPFKPRYGGEIFSKSDIFAKDIFRQSTIFEKINRKSYTLSNDYIINSDYTKFYSKGSTSVAYKKESIENFVMNLRTLVQDIPEEKFIYAYWPTFDTLAHKNGIHSLNCKNHYQELSRALENFIYSISNTNTVVIVTADHGLIDSPKEALIDLDLHPKLRDTLVMPLSGDPRAAYCYVKQGMTNSFENYVHEHLAEVCSLYKSTELVEKHLFGLDEPNPKLWDRIGDYVLIPKENYVIKDKVLGESPHYYTGHHGGVSADEMYVPVIVLES
jgi:predicted AlkP superfamily pyrophosphatase or phosphodiesterase